MTSPAFNANVDPQILGRFEIPETVLRRRLGDTTYQILQAMWHWRDYHGICRATLGTLGKTNGYAYVAEATVRDSVRILRKLGFVEDIQHRRRLLNLGREGVVWCYCRRVFGGRASSPKHDVVVRMPEKTHQILQNAPGRGRPKGAAKKHPCEIQKPNTITELQKSTPHVGQVRESEPTFAPLIEKSTPPPSEKAPLHSHLYLHQKKHPCEIRLRPDDAQLQGAAARHAEVEIPPLPLVVSVITDQHSHLTTFGGNVARVPRASDSIQTPPAGVVEFASSAGTGFVPKEHHPLPPPPGTSGVPPYPGPHIMPTARVPAPPRIPETLSQMDRAVWLGKAYRGAVETRLKCKCWILARRDQLARSKLRFVLFAGAKALFEEEIPPVAWALFSVDVWMKYETQQGKPKPPPLSWVYSPKRIEDRAGWFWAEAGSYISTRGVYGPAARELLRRYDAMRLALFQRGATTPAAVAVVVAEYLPGDMYDRLLREAKTQAQDDQARMDAAAARGDWLWR